MTASTPPTSKRVGPQLRRIVTGHDASGKAIVLEDAPAAVQKFPSAHASSTLMWITRETPADFATDSDPTIGFTGTPPPAGGTRFAIMEILPGADASPHMHRTDTVDYVICLAGEATMYLDDSKVVMKAGDVMIQRGTNHGWVNEGNVPTRIAFVLIDGTPKRTGSIASGRNVSS